MEYLLRVNIARTIPPASTAGAAGHSFEARARPAGENDVWICTELASEVRHAHAKRRGVVVVAMSSRLSRARGAGYVVIRKGNVGPVLRIERHLEEVG